MITLKNITKRYRTDTIETTALDNIQLHIQKGEFVSVMGPSGCGKSTLLNIIGLIDDPTEGEIEIDNQRIRNYQAVRSHDSEMKNSDLFFRVFI
jgi:putative ABC transport system ATP-binding protein